MTFCRDFWHAWSWGKPILVAFRYAYERGRA